MDRNLLVAIALSALVLIGYQEYLRIYYPPPLPTDRAVEAGPTPLPASEPRADAVVPPAVTAEPAPAAAEREFRPDVELETDLYSARFSTRGARLVSLRLKKYRTTVDPQSPPLELLRLAAGGQPPLGVTLRGKEAVSDADVAYAASTTALRISGTQRGEIVFRGSLANGAAVEKRVEVGAEAYTMSVRVSVSGAPAGFSEAGLAWTHELPAEASSAYSFVGVEALVGSKLHQLGEDELEQGVVLPSPGTNPAPAVHWAGFSDPYFLTALSPRQDDAVRMWGKLRGRETLTEILVPLAAAGGEGYPFHLFAGPKDTSILAAAGHHLGRTVNLGWFSFVAEPMLAVLKAFHGFTGNYGVDIILLTLLVKLAMIPLTHKSYKSMQDLQKLQPEMKRLQEKYADDRQQLNKEMMELYRRHGVNPLGGCLPMMLQMPIFIGLYNALMSAVELRHAPFALWINDLSAPDRLPPFPEPPIAEIAGVPVRIPVLTLLMGASMLVQQKMMPPAGDPAQQRIMMFMPVIFTAMFINFPSGLVIYWLMNNVLTIAQQAWMQRRVR